MTVSLTQAQANSAIAQVDEGLSSARQLLSQMADHQQNMLSTGWHGSSAGNYSNLSDQQHDDFGQILNKLTTVAETGKEHIRSVTNMDSN
jgi:uncharacterized protein YukE